MPACHPSSPGRALLGSSARQLRVKISNPAKPTRTLGSACAEEFTGSLCLQSLTCHRKRGVATHCNIIRVTAMVTLTCSPEPPRPRQALLLLLSPENSLQTSCVSTGHSTALQRHADTYEVFSTCLADEKGEKKTHCIGASWPLRFPALIHVGRCALGHAPFQCHPPNDSVPCPPRSGEMLGRTERGFCMIWHLFQLLAKARPSPASAL